MGIFDFLFGKKPKRPEVPEPASNPYQPQTIQGQAYTPTQERYDVSGALNPQSASNLNYSMDQGAESALRDVLLNRMLGNYQKGLPILEQGYRNAVLGRAKSGLDESAMESSNMLSERLNSMNLLGSTAHGTGLGDIQKERLRGLTDVENNLVQQELGQLNSAISGAFNLNDALAQRAARELGAKQWGMGFDTQNKQWAANFLSGENRNQFNSNWNSQMDANRFNQSERSMQNSTNQRNNEFAYNARNAQYENDMNRRNVMIGNALGLAGDIAKPLAFGIPGTEWGGLVGTLTKRKNRFSGASSRYGARGEPFGGAGAYGSIR